LPKGLTANGVPRMDGPAGDKFNIPAFFFIGGPTDIAYENVSHLLSPKPFSGRIDW
jgi:hypothetical protein